MDITFKDTVLAMKYPNLCMLCRLKTKAQSVNTL